MTIKGEVVSVVGNKNTLREKLEYFKKLPYTVLLEKIDDDEAPYWVARVAELPHCMIHGNSPEEAVKEIEEVKMGWIESNLKRGLTVPEPTPKTYSGQIRLRISPSLHRALTYRAQLEKVSLNLLMSTKLAESVGIMRPGSFKIKNEGRAHQSRSISKRIIQKTEA